LLATCHIGWENILQGLIHDVTRSLQRVVCGVWRQVWCSLDSDAIKEAAQGVQENGQILMSVDSRNTLNIMTAADQPTLGQSVTHGS
jgi:hypothetical protein